VSALALCEGAPRDLGADQGRACREALRGRCTAARRWRAILGRVAPGTRDAVRELRRHFPHQAEQLVGLARAAGLPVWSVFEMAWADLREPARAIGVETGAGPRLAAALPEDGLVRRMQPEGRFASLDLTRPALATALLGVNAAGLAVAHAGAGASSGPPAAALVRDCLERFEKVDPALDWCMKRPAGSGVTILLADAAGELAGVELAPIRRVLRPIDGLLVPRGAGPAASTLAKARSEGRRAFDRALAEVLSPVFGGVDPVERRLRLAGPGYVLESVDV
jgi:hypothetical protein